MITISDDSKDDEDIETDEEGDDDKNDEIATADENQDVKITRMIERSHIMIEMRMTRTVMTY